MERFQQVYFPHVENKSNIAYAEDRVSKEGNQKKEFERMEMFRSETL
jgi:hypothetical protein